MPEDTLFKISLSKAMKQCSQREYCSSDIRDKLLFWGVGKSEADEIIAILINENFINDLRYATAYVKDKFNYNKWGKIKLEVYLKAKKISPGIIKTALDSIDNEAYINMIRNLISSHRKIIKAKNQYDLKARLLRYGLSKGFESTLLYDLLNDLED